jgi:hypothetical protein
MDTPIDTKTPGFNSGRFKLDPEFRHGADKAGYWFAATIVLAVIAAGVILYRGANAEFTTASNDPVPAAAQADPISPAPLLQQR